MLNMLLLCWRLTTLKSFLSISMKIGFIARGDNSGLGTLSWEFFNHLKPHKTLLVDPGNYKLFRERFPGAKQCPRGDMTMADMEWVLDGIDILLAIETPYRYTLFKMAKERGIKTVLIPMYECLPKHVPYEPDLYICPSELDYEFIGDKPKTLIPCPINTTSLPYLHRKKAETFVFNNGHGGGGGRNGADVLFKAIDLVKSDARFIINSQVGLPHMERDNVEVVIGNYEEYFDIWGQGDVYVWPHKFDGLSLPVQEAVATGMPVLTTKFFPFTEWLPDEWLFEPSGVERKRIFHVDIDVYDVDPQVLADKIDEWYGKDISADSVKAFEIAQERSWENLLPNYLKVFEDVCGQKNAPVVKQ